MGLSREIQKSLWRIEAKLDTLLSVTVKATQKEKEMLDDLIAAVDEQTTAVDAVVAKIDELVASGSITPDQQAKIAELATRIRGNSQRLTDAVSRAA